VRVEVALTLVLFVEGMSLVETDAVVAAIEPRGSLPCTAWNLDNVVFMGALGTIPLPGASGKARSKFAGVDEGEIKATFLWGSLLAITVLTLPFVNFREFLSLGSCSV